MALASVVIPAHNEAATIGRTLAALRGGGAGDDLEVIVVCNGCTDASAEVAARADPRARVIEIPQASKWEAVRVGNMATDVFPRVHLDADVELTGADVVELLAPIVRGQVLATAPMRLVPRTGCSCWVRWYYDVWEALPQVQSGLFGRGVVALSERAEGRVERLSEMMNDDLGLSDAFSAEERRVVTSAVAVVRPPRTLRDLVRRRVRIATGNAQAARLGARHASSRTRLLTLAGLAVSRPGVAIRLPVFLGVYAAATLGARRAIRAADFSTWQRDESSRASV